MSIEKLQYHTTYNWVHWIDLDVRNEMKSQTCRPNKKDIFGEPLMKSRDNVNAGRRIMAIDNGDF